MQPLAELQTLADAALQKLQVPEGLTPNPGDRHQAKGHGFTRKPMIQMRKRQADFTVADAEATVLAVGGVGNAAFMAAQ